VPPPEPSAHQTIWNPSEQFVLISHIYQISSQATTSYRILSSSATWYITFHSLHSFVNLIALSFHRFQLALTHPKPSSTPLRFWFNAFSQFFNFLSARQHVQTSATRTPGQIAAIPHPPRRLFPGPQRSTSTVQSLGAYHRP